MPNLDEGTDETTDDEVVSTDESTVTESAPAESVNPAWEGLRSKLDPISFHNIQDDLKAMDSAAQQRITSQNEQLKPWKTFVDSGNTPEKVQQALTIADQLEKNPEAIYQYLGQFLQQTGRMPTSTEIQKADDAGELDDGSQQETEDPRFQQLAQQQQAITAFLEQQQMAQVQQAADAELDVETRSLRAAHPELSDDDQTEIIRRAAFVAQQNQMRGVNKIPSLEEAYSDYAALRTRILSTPRPGGSAPKLLPTSGGMPTTSGQQKTLGQLSRSETQDLISSLVAQSNQTGR